LVWPSQKHALRIIAEATSGWPEVGVGLTDVTSLFRQ
jgi:hypothetical protein